MWLIFSTGKYLLLQTVNSSHWLITFNATLPNTRHNFTSRIGVTLATDWLVAAPCERWCVKVMVNGALPSRSVKVRTYSFVS